MTKELISFHWFGFVFVQLYRKRLFSCPSWRILLCGAVEGHTVFEFGRWAFANVWHSLRRVNDVVIN